MIHLEVHTETEKRPAGEQDGHKTRAKACTHCSEHRTLASEQCSGRAIGHTTQTEWDVSASTEARRQVREHLLSMWFTNHSSRGLLSWARCIRVHWNVCFHTQKSQQSSEKAILPAFYFLGKWPI